MPRARKPGPLNEAVNTGHPAAEAVAPGMPYGQRQAIEQSLAQAPIPGPNAQPNVAPQADPITDAQNTPFAPVGLFNPTTQPGTPVTAGIPTGPGPGPEALIPATNPDSEALKSLVPLLEILASGPNSTYATRNFLRTLRSTVTP